jgi:hypothetical protein
MMIRVRCAPRSGQLNLPPPNGPLDVAQSARDEPLRSRLISHRQGATSVAMRNALEYKLLRKPAGGGSDCNPAALK